jgi:hypothetical protein
MPWAKRCRPLWGWRDLHSESLGAGHQATAQTENSSAIPPWQNVLCRTAYYHEYMRYKRPDKDGALMRQAGFSVVRMAKSTWSLWEPANRSEVDRFGGAIR